MGVDFDLWVFALRNESWRRTHYQKPSLRSGRERAMVVGHFEKALAIATQFFGGSRRCTHAAGGISAASQGCGKLSPYSPHSSVCYKLLKPRSQGPPFIAGISGRLYKT